MEKRLMGFFAALMAVLCASAAFAEGLPVRTPDGMRERMNGILFYEEEENAAPFAEMVDFDDAGGFDFCTVDGERMLETEHASAFIRGRLDEDGRVCELSLIMHPRCGFGRAYSRQADRLARAYMLSLFGDLSEADIALLMDSYLYDIRPYRYNESDCAVAPRVRMCEIELGSEVVRVDSEAAGDNALMLSVTFLYEPDEDTRERARENGWRIRRIAQAASECEMIQTCGELLEEIEINGIEGDQEDIEALLELMEQSAGAIAGMETEHMHAQEVFLFELQELCAQLTEWMADYHAALDEGDVDTARLNLKEICRVSAEIGCLPETLY